MNIVYLGNLEYFKALHIQKAIHAQRHDGRIGDTLLLVEHPPVLTIGRHGTNANIRVSPEWLTSQGVSVYPVNRGGDVTYHGPGQLVGYPIMDLAERGRDVRNFIWSMEEVFIQLLLYEFKIMAERDLNKYTGVWIGQDKITSIGVAVKKWVTMHGFAFNINTNLSHFNWIVPCGLMDRGVTSLERLTGQTLDMRDMVDMVAQYFCMVFNTEPQWIRLEDIGSERWSTHVETKMA